MVMLSAYLQQFIPVENLAWGIQLSSSCWVYKNSDRSAVNTQRNCLKWTHSLFCCCNTGVIFCLVWFSSCQLCWLFCNNFLYVFRALKTIDALALKIQFTGPSMSISTRNLALGVSSMNSTSFRGSSFSVGSLNNASDFQVQNQQH